MRQRAYSFDQVTVEKIKRSALIACVGILVTVGPAALIELSDVIERNDPFDWRKLILISLSAFGAWLFNVGRQWRAGQPKE